MIYYKMRILLFTEQSNLASNAMVRILQQALDTCVWIPKSVKNSLTIVDVVKKQAIAATYRVWKVPHVVFADSKMVLLEINWLRTEKQLKAEIRFAYDKHQRNNKREEVLNDE